MRREGSLPNGRPETGVAPKNGLSGRYRLDVVVTAPTEAVRARPYACRVGTRGDQQRQQAQRQRDAAEIERERSEMHDSNEDIHRRAEHTHRYAATIHESAGRLFDAHDDSGVSAEDEIAITDEVIYLLPRPDSPTEHD
jgi:hypothetical protein